VEAIQRNTLTVLRREVAAGSPLVRVVTGGELPSQNWCPMTPPVMQGSAVCLLDTAKPMTGKSIFTYF
jgi:hypothetical protein